MKFKMHLIPLVTLLISFNTFAATWYVAVDGNDNTGNGSQTLPWQTIAYGIENMAAGDTLLIQEGDYDEPIVLDHTLSGLSESQQTVIKAEGVVSVLYITLIGDDSESPVQFAEVDGFNIRSYYSEPNLRAGLLIRNADYCLIENLICKGIRHLYCGFMIDNADYCDFINNDISDLYKYHCTLHGVYMKNSHHNRFIGNSIKDNLSDAWSCSCVGVALHECDNTSFINNRIEHNYQTDLDWPNSAGAEGPGYGVYLWDVNNTVFQGNYFARNKTASIAFHGANNTVVEDNRFDNYKNALSLKLNEAESLIVQRNIFTGYPEIYFNRNCDVVDVSINNNYFTAVYYDFYYQRVWNLFPCISQYLNNSVPQVTRLENVSIYNNMFFSTHKGSWRVPGEDDKDVPIKLQGPVDSIYIDYNAYSTSFSGLSSMETGEHNIQLDGFGLRGNYMLTIDSPCIGAGLDGSDIGFDPVENWLDYDADAMPDIWEMKYLNVLDLVENDGDNNSDSDTLLNKEEFLCGTRPDDADSDNDGMTDGEEDADNDNLCNYQECVTGLDVNNPDSDFDGMLDGWEVENGLDPLAVDANEDSDGDGVSNYQEFLLGFDPNAVDTDGNGFSDGTKLLGTIDFESYYIYECALRDENTAFRAWVSTGIGLVSLVEGAGEDGSCALYSDRTGTTDPLSLYLFTVKETCGEATPQPGHYYRMSFKGKGYGNACIGVYWEINDTLNKTDEGDVQIRPWTWKSPEAFSLTEEWQIYESLVFIPEDHTFIGWKGDHFQSFFKLMGDGVFYIDDIKIEEISPVYTIDFVDDEILDQMIKDEDGIFRCWVNNGAGLVNLVEIGDNTARLTSDRIGADDLELYLFTVCGYIGEMPPRPGRTYQMSFSARGEGDPNVRVYFNRTASQHRTADGGVVVEPCIWQSPSDFALSSEWKTYSFVMTLPADDDNSFIQWDNSRDAFVSMIKLMGGGSYEITDITLMEVIETSP